MIPNAVGDARNVPRPRWVPLLALGAGIVAMGALAGHGRAQVQPPPLKAGIFAPDIDKGGDWLGVNQRLTLKELRGKFVILDFWTLC